MTDSYQTLARSSEAQLKDKGSRFLAFAFPIRSTADADAHIEALRKKFFDSRHVCFAWRIGADGSQARAYDAGEPMHSAGVPILNQIRSFQVTDVLVVVVRYFGGIQLGIPGLIAAYGGAAKAAIEANEIVQKFLHASVTVRFRYEDTALLNRIIHQQKAEIADTAFAEDCVFTLQVRASQAPQLREELKKNGIFIVE